MRLLLFLVSMFSICNADIKVEDLKQFQQEKINEVFVGLLNTYIQMLKDLDECVDICEILKGQTGNDMQRIVSLNEEIMHYKRCKYLLMTVMVKSHPMLVLSHCEQFKEFALEALEVSDSIGSI